MNNITGQTNIFDLIQKEQEPEPPVMLKTGQKVYKLIRGDVQELMVCDDKSWLCGDHWENRGYRLKDKSGCYGCTWNSELGSSVFTDYDSALKLAGVFLKTHDVILAEDIKPVKTIAYQYIRECDNRTMTAFYSGLDNEMLYMKGFMTFAHIVDNNTKEIKQFMEQQEFEYCNPVQTGYQPEYRNMYRCENSQWKYAEAGYTYATG